MLSAAQEQQLKRTFESFDFDDDGVVELSDLEQLGHRFAMMRDFSPGSPQGEAIQSRIRQVWQATLDRIDADEDRAVTLAEWTRGYGSLILEGTEFADGFAAMLFETMDRDGDGRIHIADYVLLLWALGIDTRQAEVAFQQFDRDGKGWLSGDEWTQMSRQFWGSDPQAPGQRIMNPAG